MIGQNAHAGQIQCWKAEAREKDSSFMAAEILPGNTVGNLQFFWNENWAALNVAGAIRGKVVTLKSGSFISYIENQRRFQLLLPQDLSSQNLAATARLAVLNGKNSNAYFAYHSQNSEPKGLYLICYSDIY